MFRSNIERWADGLEMAEMCQGGDFSLEKGSWEAPRCIRVYQDTIGVPYEPKNLPHFLVSTVLTLKMHKNGLEKNRSQPPLLPVSSRGTLTHPESLGKVPSWTTWDIFFYRVRQQSSFYVLLLF